MVERHGAILADIIQAVVMEKDVATEKQLSDVVLHACMAKNRRPGRIGYSRRSIVFGLDERLVASGLNHYLEDPGDASIAAAQKEDTFKFLLVFNLKSSVRRSIPLLV